jgi:phosphate-selective porin OprO/OprP
MHRPLAVSALALALAATLAPAHAADPSTAELLARIAALEQRIAVLEGTGTAATDVDQRLRVVERKQELQDEADAAKAASAPTVSLGEKGLSMKSADNAFEVKVRGLVQGDGRMWFGDDDIQHTDPILIQRFEPTSES